MAESKVFMFPENNNSGILSMLAPLLQQRGIDPNVLLSMSNNGFGGNNFIWTIFLFFLMGWGGDGFGRNNRNGQLENLINNDSGRELLMQAIQGNQNTISQLSTSLGCDINSVKSAINSVMTQIQNVGNQVGMSGQQIINAIQAGNCTIAGKIADCCCENRLATCQQTNTLQNSINNVAAGQERGFSNITYETQKQTCDIQNSIRNATDQIIAGQRNAEMREMQNKIDSLRELNSQKDIILNNAQQTATFGQMIQPIANAVGALQNDVNGIKCKLPETVTLPFSCATAVPTNLLYSNGVYGGFYGNCNNSLWG